MEYVLSPSPSSFEAAEAFWKEHPFYTSAVVLGIDVGLEGIGVFVRKGPQRIYAKTLLFDVPQPDRLLQRRQFRAARHCRKNRQRRLRRLKRLMEAHGLPWVADEVLSRSDPYQLRHRAVEKRLASREALSICIRHLVTHRGYDYYANIEGDFPWGADTNLSKAMDWVRNSHIDDTVASVLESIAPELTGPRDEKKLEEKRTEFLALVNEKREESKKGTIRELLAHYVSQKKPNFRDRARGANFPRAQVEAHLREIIERHRDLIDRSDDFIAALFLKPDPSRPGDKKRAIFHYNRKTKDEIAAVWERKVKDCPFTSLLDLPGAKVGTNGDPDVRRWSLLQFLGTRSFEVQRSEGKGVEKKTHRSTHRPSAEVIQSILTAIRQTPPPDWPSIKKSIVADVAKALPGAKEVPSTQSPFNKDFFTHLQDLTCPSPANQKRRASLCAASAARLYEIATDGGRDFTPSGINLRLNAIGFYNHRRTPGSGGVPYPQVSFLMGQRKKNGKDAGKLAVPGRLHRIFESIEDKLGGIAAPEYCVIEVVGTLPRNTEQKREIEKLQNERRANREKLFAEYQREDSGGQSSRRRIDLYDQQRGRCPYTGRDLGDPHAPDLNIDHIFPQSRGGLSVDQNLVLTFQSVNHGLTGKGDRTPREAAEAGLPGFLSWPAMLKNIQDMKWGKPKAPGEMGGDRKIDIFTFTPTESKPIPDFGNTTRTAQLARQLIEEVAEWMGIARDADERARRIGTPSGWLAAQARKTWIGEDKNRSRLIHHLVDAAVLAHIPPREGMNHIRCRGIFYPDQIEVIDPATGKKKTRPVTRALPDLGPSLDSLAPLLHPEPLECPVEKHRPRKRTASLGDSTFWRLDTATGSTYQRVPLDPEKFATPEAVEAALRALGIPLDVMPTYRAISDWLDGGAAAGKPLKLKNGTPVRRGAKKDGKGSLKAPAGWSGTIAPTGSVAELRVVSPVFDRLELWLGWDGRKWAYFRKRVPNSTARRHLQRFIPDWDTIAPPWVQANPERPETHKTLREIVCGEKLPQGAVRVAIFRRGDVFRLGLDSTGVVTELNEATVAESWYELTSVKASGEVEFSTLLAKSREVPPFDRFVSDICLKPRIAKPSKLAALAGLPPAESHATYLGLLKPTARTEDDPPPHPPRRRTRTPRETGQTDFGFAEDCD